MDKNRNLKKQLVMLIGDILLMGASIYFALALRYLRQPDVATVSIHLRSFVPLFFIWAIVLFINGLYDIAKTRNSTFFFKTFFQSIFVCGLLSIAYFYLLPRLPIEPRTNLLLIVGVFCVLFISWRILIHSVIMSRALRKKVLFIGARGEAFELIDAIHTNPQFGYEVTAILEPGGALPPPDEHEKIRWLTNLGELKQFVAQEKIATVVVAPNQSYGDTVARELYDTIFWAIEITDLVSFYETMLGRIPVTALSETWFLENLQESQKKHYDTVKQFIDFILSSLLGVITLLLLPFVATAIYLEDKGSIFYTQRRMGKHGVEFLMYKFRTMRMDAEKGGAQFAEMGDPRVTRVGRILRKTRIDELPQIWNILKRQMTIVGPRPERPEFVKYFSDVIPFYTVRHLIKPGITGWAQINYPYYATVGENMRKLQYDLYYIKNRSMFLDARIILKTINTIMRWMGI